MKINLESSSKRTQSLILNPMFLKPQITSEFEVTMDSSDNILTVFHRKNLENMDFIFAEVLVRFLLGKNFSHLWKTNFREIESFLRDENHLPAFGFAPEILEEELKKTKISLGAGIIRAKIKGSLSELSLQKNSWKNLSLVQKNLWAKNLISPLGWQLILCELDVLTLTNTPPDFSNMELTALLAEVFAETFIGVDQGLPVKVVAV